MGARSIESLVRRYVNRHSKRDHKLAETICMNSKPDLITIFSEHIKNLQISRIPNHLEKGLILHDSRGRGTPIYPME